MSTKDRDRVAPGGGFTLESGENNSKNTAGNGVNSKTWNDNNIKAMPLKV